MPYNPAPAVTSTVDPIAPTLRWEDLGLDPAHVTYLRTRGVSPDVAKARGYRSTTPASDKRLAEAGWSRDQRAWWREANLTPRGNDSLHLVRALAIPFHDAYGDKCIVQLRLDVPRVIETPAKDGEGKPTSRTPKFELPAYNPDEGETEHTRRGNGRGNIPADINPAALAWLSEDDPDVPILLSEGALKTDAVTSAALREGIEIVAVCLSGVTMGYHGAGTPDNPGRHPILTETMVELPWEDRTVYLAWDADWMTNPAVAHALVVTGRLLREAGATVYVVNIPPEGDSKRGIDDWLADRTDAGARTPLIDLLNRNVITLAEAELIEHHYSMDDTGRGERLADLIRYRGDMRFSTEAKSWLSWSGKVWERDADAAVLHRAQGLTGRDIADPAAYRAGRSANALRAAVTLAAVQPGIVISEAELDADPWLLNTTSGIVDLHSGDLLPHDPAALQTICTPGGYDPAMPTPVWTQFLQETFMRDTELIGYVQHLLGLALIGRVQEEVLVVMYGSGKNGKSTLIEAVMRALGQYAVIVNSGMLTGDISDEEKYALMGRRLAVAAETGVGASLDEAAMKTVTSRDPLSARQMYQARVTFEPSHTTIMMTNHRPAVRAMDTGTWPREMSFFSVEMAARKSSIWPRSGGHSPLRAQPETIRSRGSRIKVISRLLQVSTPALR